MIDAEPRGRILGNQPQNQAMRCLENHGIFHANADKIRDREKATVIDAFVEVLPECQLVVLLAEQTLEKPEAAGIAGLAVDVVDTLFEKVGNFLASG